jgi:hypothetical protein
MCASNLSPAEAKELDRRLELAQDTPDATEILAKMEQ